MAAKQDNWETTEAFNWIANDEGLLRQAQDEATYGIYRFRVWAEDCLTRLTDWNDEWTADVDFDRLMEAILSE